MLARNEEDVVVMERGRAVAKAGLAEGAPGRARRGMGFVRIGE